MKRRDALKTAGLILGYTITAGTTAAVIGGCSADPKTGWEPEFLNQDQASIIKELASTIIPGTDELPGAKDVMIEKFIDETIVNYGEPEEKDLFLEGIKAIEEKMAGNLDDEAKMSLIKSELEAGSEFMTKVRELTIVGFCTSERGAKEVLVFNPIPGEQKGCIPLEEVGGIWYL